MAIVVNYPDVGGMYGIKRYSLELVRALQGFGLPVKARASLAKEWSFGRLRVGGLLTRRLANYVPVVGADLIHATNYHINPRFTPADVVTVHDVMPFSRPELWGMSPHERKQHDRDIRRAVATALIIVDSEHTRCEMVRLFDVDRSRITPVHLGISHDVFYPQPFSAQERLSSPFGRLLRPNMLNVLIMQSTEPRKRVDLALEVARKLPFVNVVRVGSPRTHDGMRWIIEKIRPHAKALSAEGRFTHIAHARDEDLRRLYSSVDVMLHPSEDEGFGLPPLEALGCGARVLASDIPCHREILGDAARYFPLTVEGIRDALTRSWDGEHVVDSLFPPVESRVSRARQYTWTRTARETLEVYERARPGTSAGALSPQELEVVRW